MNEQQRKAAAVVALAELLPPRKEISVAALKMYVAALAGLSADQVERATAKAAATCQMMPSPSELRGLAGEMTPEARALAAWDAACRAARRVGEYMTVQFDDPYTTATIRSMGGWGSFCDPEEEEHWQRKRFLETYRTLLTRRIGTEEAAPLVGIHGRNNATLADKDVPPGMRTACGLDPVSVTTGLPAIEGPAVTQPGRIATTGLLELKAP